MPEDPAAPPDPAFSNHAPLSEKERVVAFLAMTAAISAGGGRVGLGRVTHADDRGVDLTFSLPNFMARDLIASSPDSEEHADALLASGICSVPSLSASSPASPVSPPAPPVSLQELVAALRPFGAVGDIPRRLPRHGVEVADDRIVRAEMPLAPHECLPSEDGGPVPQALLVSLDGLTVGDFRRAAALVAAAVLRV